jgi:hypothetical protein
MHARTWVSRLILFSAAGASSGCFLVAAGAGAGAVVAYTNRGATANVPGSVNTLFDRSLSVFGSMQISETGRSTEDSGALRRLVGKTGDLEITVELKRSSDEVTKVEVVARRSAVDYDKEIAKSVLDRIVKAP